MRQLKITKQVTNRDSESLGRYLSEIEKFQLISAQEELELFERIKKGDNLAKNELVNGHLKFVVSVAKQYQNRGLSLSDLINEGNLGLIKAVNRVDQTMNFKFIAYAHLPIRESILHAIVEYSRLIRLPVKILSNIHKVQRAFVMLEQIHVRRPTNDEIARDLNIHINEVDEVIQTINNNNVLEELKEDYL